MGRQAEFEHLSKRTDILWHRHDREEERTEDRPQDALRSDRIKEVFSRLFHQPNDRKNLASLYAQVAKDKDLEAFLYRLHEENPKSLLSSVDLTAAIAFYRAHPNWWAQNVETCFEHLAESMRRKSATPEDRAVLDVELGIAQGTYEFGKGLVTGVASIFQVGWSFATDPKVRAHVRQVGNQLGFLYFRLNFGPPEVQEGALKEIAEWTTQVGKAIADSFQKEWAEAVTAGREIQLVSQWITRGVLEIGTLVLAVTKGPKAAETVIQIAEEVPRAPASLGEKLKGLRVAIGRPFQEVVRPSLKVAEELFPGRNVAFRKEFAKIQGRVVGVYSAITTEGSLPEKLGKTFSGGRYVDVVLDKPLIAYRAWAPGTDASEFGAFWSLTEPKGTLAAKIDVALLPKWGEVSTARHLRSQATRMTTIRIPAGSTIRFGEAGTQGGVWVGGRSQLAVEGSVKAAWKIGKEEILK